MKRYIMLLLFIFSSTSCVKHTPHDTCSVPAGNNDLKDFVSDNKGGWCHVKWNEVPLAKISQSTSDKISQEGKTVENELNSRYSNTSGTYNTGVFVHGEDSVYDNPNTLFDPTKDYTATSYLRSDLSTGFDKTIWNNTFQMYDLGAGSAGVIYNAVTDITKIFCVYPIDASSDVRYLGCNTQEEQITKGTPDFKNDVQTAWDNKSSINICEKLGIKTEQDFENYKPIKAYDRYSPCPLSNSESDFKMFSSLYRKHNDFIWSLGQIDWNEIVLRIFNRANYADTVEAIFYLSAEHEPYYNTPRGNIKQYNVHLARAQYFQEQLYSTKHIFKPIIEINMDEVKNGSKPFHFYPEDQVVQE